MLEVLGVVAQAAEPFHLLEEGLVAPDLAEALPQGSEEPGKQRKGGNVILSFSRLREGALFATTSVVAKPSLKKTFSLICCGNAQGN